MHYLVSKVLVPKTQSERKLAAFTLKVAQVGDLLNEHPEGQVWIFSHTKTIQGYDVATYCCWVIETHLSGKSVL